MSMIRKIKRDMLKRELGTNNISEEFHLRYGYKPNKDKKVLKGFFRWLKKKRKNAHKKARLNKLKRSNENGNI